MTCLQVACLKIKTFPSAMLKTQKLVTLIRKVYKYTSTYRLVCLRLPTVITKMFLISENMPVHLSVNVQLQLLSYKRKFKLIHYSYTVKTPGKFTKKKNDYHQRKYPKGYFPVPHFLCVLACTIYLIVISCLFSGGATKLAARGSSKKQTQMFSF